jgi:hypothetical protein
MLNQIIYKYKHEVFVAERGLFYANVEDRGLIVQYDCHMRLPYVGEAASQI